MNMDCYEAAKLIASQSPRCKWVCSWSNYHSAWEVDGVLMVYAKVHRKAEPFAGIKKREYTLYGHEPKTRSTDPRMAHHLAEIDKP